MRIAELGARARRRMRAAVIRARHRAGLAIIRPGPVDVAAEFRHPIDAARRDALVEAYRARFADRVASEARAAARLMEHRFELLGHDARHGPAIDWSLDPASGRSWSRGFSPDIPYRGPGRLGDIKLPWELAKHQYFFTLGKMRWLSGDDAYGEEIVRQIEHWIADNPCYRGIHWISALESGTRVVAWILAYPFIADLLDERSRARLLTSMAEQLLFVEDNLSADRFANTHLVGEAAALLVGGLFLRSPHSARWRRKGLAHLEAEIERQVRPDGAHAEQSVAYHRFCLDHYYLAQALLEANGQSLRPATCRAMARMTRFLADMLLPSGDAPNVGDADDARGLWCHDACPRDFRGLLALGAVLFERADLKHAAGAPSEELLWLHGPEALRRFDALEGAPPERASVAYPHAGYYVLRSGHGRNGSALLFDCGPLGYGGAAHGHADMLSFCLHASGYSFVVDSGTYSYNIDYELRDAFRSTRAHNTVVVDGADQSVPAGRMAWSHVANAQARGWLGTDWLDLVDGEHDGYRRLPDPVTHRRIVLFVKPDAWIVYDLLSAGGGHDAELFLHLRPDCRAEIFAAERRAELRSPDRARLLVAFRPTRGAEAPPEMTLEQQPYSERYGARTDGKALRLGARFTGTLGLVTSLTTSGDVSIDVLDAGDFLRVEVGHPERAPTTVIYALTDAPIPLGDRRLAKALLCWRGPADDPATLRAYDRSALLAAGSSDAAG